MAKPALLHIAKLPVVPDSQEEFESKFEHFYLWDQKDRESFFKEKGSLIKGVVTDTKGWVNEELLQKLPNVEIVSSNSVGLDKVDLNLCKERGIIVTNTPDVLTDCTAETALALLLACMRQIPAADRYVREGRWPTEGDFRFTTKVSGKRVGVVGLGRIGAAIAKRCEGFGCKISYYARSKKSDYPHYSYYSSVVDLAKNSDILIAACALTKETTSIINREVLDALGPEGFVVNIARGPVIDEVELVKALVEKRIAGAGLDVFVNEPEVPKELLDMDNVTLQPHVGSATVETRNDMSRLVMDNLIAHFSGQPVLTPAE
ncbi:hypothetical protein R1sor_002413 [Riccia sorocarpa]|uniref:Hydroxyphenylpyruvate reductase n=1 Tax=Riccia sorocarpa TaxID=122646 RepID=A0ABD3H0V8_9MARC